MLEFSYVLLFLHTFLPIYFLISTLQQIKIILVYTEKSKIKEIMVIVKTDSVFFDCVWYCTLKEDERGRETAEIGEVIVESGLH